MHIVSQIMGLPSTAPFNTKVQECSTLTRRNRHAPDPQPNHSSAGSSVDRAFQYKSPSMSGPLTILVIIGILDMEKATSVLAALDAGKFPDQNQVNQAIDWVLINGIPEIEPSGRGELSAQGKIIANGLREVLQAYKQLGSNKNGQCLRR
jgi:hypothetical protein